MSYWNIHEPEQDSYNFDELDWQLDFVAKHGGVVSLRIGKRQPRWPECHIPGWAIRLPKEQWYEALYKYIEVVVKRYKDHPALVSWQLENEALLKEFGHCVDQDYNPARLEAEYRLIKSIDAEHPVIMTLSDSWGMPWRYPRPDAYAMSLYRTTLNKKGNYTHSTRPVFFYKTRATLIRMLRGKQVFIHELQAEPWLATGVLQTHLKEQLTKMSPENIKENIAFAIRTGMKPIDLWGLEWWYWTKENQGRPEYWQAVKKLMNA